MWAPNGKKQNRTKMPADVREALLRDTGEVMRSAGRF
jgi:hypothetical protein